MNIKISKSRNLGIDLLRMVSMFMVVILHVLSQGGIIDSTKSLSTNYNSVWFLEIAALCAVNCFALISGYVSIDFKFSYHRIISLWLQIAFYTIIITSLFAIFIPGSVIKQVAINAFLPVTSRQYWYFTAYFGLFFFMPMLNCVIDKMNQKNFMKLIISIVIIFTILPTLARSDLFNTLDGYSTFWLMALYLIGAYLKKYSVANKFKARWYAIIYFICITLTWLSKIILDYLEIYKGITINEFSLLRYTSPTIFIAGISLLLFFSKLNIQNSVAKNLIKIFAPLSFSVFIIHYHTLIYSRLLFNRFVNYGAYKPIKLIIATLLTAFAIYVLCSLIDLIRYHLFNLMNVNKFSLWVESKIKTIYHKVLKNIT